MDIENKWQQVENEMINARLARENGNEGKARVCARRAVGFALILDGYTNMNALTAIQAFSQNMAVTEEIRNLSFPLLEKVDENHELQSGIDLVDNAQKIITYIQTTQRD
jgi:hypothetical protein